MDLHFSAVELEWGWKDILIATATFDTGGFEAGDGWSVDVWSRHGGSYRLRYRAKSRLQAEQYIELLEEELRAKGFATFARDHYIPAKVLRSWDGGGFWDSE